MTIKIKIKNKKNISERKRKKKQCGPGSPYHNEDGEFSSQSDATSWSISTKGTDCSRGQSRVSNGQRRIAKKDRTLTPPRCGRADPKSPNRKAREKCKGGKALEALEPESMDFQLSEDEVSQDEIYRQAKTIQRLKRQIAALQQQIVRLEKKKKSLEPPSLQDYLKFCSDLERVDKGKY